MADSQVQKDAPAAEATFLKPPAGKDHIVREPGYTPWGKATFVILRALDPAVIYALLEKGLGNKILQWAFKLTPIPGNTLANPRQRWILTMASIGAARQIFWLSYTNQNAIPLSLSSTVGIFNLVVDSIHSLVSLRTPAGRSLGLFEYIGIGIFVLGSFLETFSEIQRTRFKRDPKNKGQLFTGGLFSLAQHINYTGYVLWRGGIGMMTGSVIGALWSPAFHLWQFGTHAIPHLQHYMRTRYGRAHEVYGLRTKLLIPYVY